MGNHSTLEATPILIEKDQPAFVVTPHVKGILKWALIYIRSGFPLHLRGPSGTGKTTLAVYIAAQIGRPVILIHGDEELGTSDLVGGEHGYRAKRLVDNFIHSVLKSEEEVQRAWVDNRLTVACRHGFTLLYDEFTRSRPEANNVLLSILEEKILDLPAARDEESYLRVHPDFSAIFTSNPDEYAGVYKVQDALKDRMITINLDHYDRETEMAITCAKSGISHREAERIVDIVRDLRNRNHGSSPTVRACIMIAKVLNACQAKAAADDENFIKVCLDVLDSEKGKAREIVLSLINKYCEIPE